MKMTINSFILHSDHQESPTCPGQSVATSEVVYFERRKEAENMKKTIIVSLIAIALVAVFTECVEKDKITPIPSEPFGGKLVFGGWDNESENK